MKQSEQLSTTSMTADTAENGRADSEDTTGADVFAEWLRRQGLRVIRTPSSYWYESVRHVFQAFPYHALIQPDDKELSTLHGMGAWALRYSTPVDKPRGALSYHVILAPREYNLEALPSNARGHVRKGLAISVVEPISLRSLAQEGWELRQDTLSRQGREQAESKDWWQRLCLAAEGLPGFEAWGALVDGKLAAALLAFEYADHYSILYQQSRTEFMRFGVNNALTFVVTSDVMDRPSPRTVFYGVQSLDAPASVDEYKFQMRYVAKPVRQRVVFHPWARVFLNVASHLALRLGSRAFPNDFFLSKTEGMVRFYLQGNLPPSRQSIPAPLEPYSPAESQPHSFLHRK